MAFKNTLLPVAASLSSQGHLLSLERPIVMGILNASPDSFYTGSAEPDRLLALAEKMLQEGAAILDVGGVSTRPGAEEVSESEELQRVLPLITSIVQRFPEAWLSVDTFRARVAEACVAAGARIINDVCAGSDEGMLPTVARLKVPYIAMHMQGTPRTMQDNPQYEHVVQEVFDFLKDTALRCRHAGIQDLILDPGFGFGKTKAHNYALLNELSAFRAIGHPILAGISRKRMICETLGLKPADALNGSTALHMVALCEGASILRVHDVKEAMECIRLYEQFQ
ncbi:MAG: dihydropteroate synthase [Bacteroidetes bacterium]|nr:dihydropteroate synthase [Bacteroidota bacterium]